MNKALLIMAHGSRAEAANREFKLLVHELARVSADYAVVLPCFLELATPSLHEAVLQLERQSVGIVHLYPLFFNGGKHVAFDIPAQVREARERHPRLDIHLLDYFGRAPGLVALMRDHIAAQQTG